MIAISFQPFTSFEKAMPWGENLTARVSHNLCAFVPAPSLARSAKDTRTFADG
jgi:hypothetical protein